MKKNENMLGGVAPRTEQEPEMLDSIQRNGRSKSGIECRAMEEEMPACNAGGMDGVPASDAGITDGDARITDEALREVLHKVQWMRKIVKTDIKVFLVTEDWDWLVIMECLQDHGIFKVNPERMPFRAFEDWMQCMPQYLSECNARKMGHAYNLLSGARYPWKDVDWYPCVLRRWRALYQILDRMLSDLGV